MMKKIIIASFVVFSLFVLNFGIRLNGSFAETKDDNSMWKTTTLLEDAGLLEDLRALSDGYLTIQHNATRYFVENAEIYKVIGNFIDVYETSDFIYILYWNNRYILNQFDKVKKTNVERVVEDIVLNGLFVLDNEEIILYGNKNLHASYIRLESMNGASKLYTVKGKEATDFKLGVNYPFGFAFAMVKNAITEDSDFENVGNVGEKKTALVKYNLDNELEDTLYFNENTSYETPHELVFKNNCFYLSLNIRQLVSNVIYCIDNNNIIRKQVYSLYPSSLHLVKGNSTKWIKTTIWEDKVEFQCFDKLNLSKQLDYKTIYAQFIALFKGNWLLGVQDGTKSSIILLEYIDVPFVEEKNCYFDDYDLDDYSNVHMNSYFEEPIISTSKITPYFEKRMSGNYDITYKISHEDGRVEYKKTKLIVHDYENFQDGSIVPLGFVLDFFGAATLNQEPISPGYSLTTEGDYEICITNNEGLKRMFTIHVVDGYYKSPMVSSSQNVIYATPGEKVLIHQKVSGTLSDKLKLYCNGSLCDFTYIDEEITFSIQASNQYECKRVDIELKNNNNLCYSFQVYIQTICPRMEYELVEEDEEEFNFKVLIKDEMKMIDCVRVEIVGKDFLYNKYIYLKDYEVELPVMDNSLNYTMNCYLVASLNGENKEYLLNSMNFKKTKNLDMIGLMKFTFEDELLVQITWETSPDTKPTKVILGKKNITEHYFKENDLTVLFVSSGLFVGCGLVLVGVLIYKKKKMRKRIEKE